MKTFLIVWIDHDNAGHVYQLSADDFANAEYKFLQTEQGKTFNDHIFSITSLEKI